MSAPARDIRVPVAPMTAESFAPYGEVFGHAGGARERVVAATGFAHRGRVTLGTIFNPHGETVFSRLERHFAVTQAFVQIAGAPAVICVAPPTDPDDPAALPQPEHVRGFRIDPGLGYLLHRGTWHALDRQVLAAPGATFLIVNVDPNPTQVVDLATGECWMYEDLGGAPPPRALPRAAGERVRFRVAG